MGKVIQLRSRLANSIGVILHFCCVLNYKKKERKTNVYKSSDIVKCTH